jgi:hypothetical protein
MKRISMLMAFIAISFIHANCYGDCNCDVWEKRDGYCVDYVKSKIPSFPIPNSVSEISALKNKEISEVKEGDVAIFDLGKYWHVAYIEKVHLDQQGKATTIDVSEMNFGGKLSFDEYTNKWSPKNKSEWERALCCGVTDKYDQTSWRRNVALNTVTQIWSPATAASEAAGTGRGNAIATKAWEVFNRIYEFMERVL